MEISKRVKGVLAAIAVLLALPVLVRLIAPDLYKYASFIVDIAISISFLFPLYLHHVSNEPALVNAEKMDKIRENAGKLKRQISLEKFVSILAAFVYFGVSLNTFLCRVKSCI